MITLSLSLVLVSVYPALRDLAVTILTFYSNIKIEDGCDILRYFSGVEEM